MLSMIAQATSKGRVVSWADFKRGELRDDTGVMTTMLTDVVCDAIDHCLRHPPESRFVVLRANGFWSAKFDVMVEGATTRICCGRRLVRGGFPLNFTAAEDPRNYDVLVTAASTLPEFEQSLGQLLGARYVCRPVPMPYEFGKHFERALV